MVPDRALAHCWVAQHEHDACLVLAAHKLNLIRGCLRFGALRTPDITLDVWRGSGRSRAYLRDESPTRAGTVVVDDTGGEVLGGALTTFESSDPGTLEPTPPHVLVTVKPCQLPHRRRSRDVDEHSAKVKDLCKRLEAEHPEAKARIEDAVKKEPKRRTVRVREKGAS